MSGRLTYDPTKDPSKWVKVNKTRRARGYSFEDKVRAFFNRLDNETFIHARRLGGSSTGLPDLVITNNHPSHTSIVAMECKSVQDSYVAVIPADQVIRCITTLQAFEGGYNQKYVGFGFKFMQSVKCKRKKSIDRYWLLSMYDPLFNDNLLKVTYDIRTEMLTFHYKDGGKSAISGNIQNNWYPDLYRLADVLDPMGVSHSERQIRQDRKQDTLTSLEPLGH